MSKNYVDFSEAYKAINKTKRSTESVAAKGVNEAALYAQRILSNNTPTYNTHTSDRVHAKDHTIIKKATKNNLNAEVGFDKEVAWRVHFVEFGTIKQKPNAFIQKTMKQVENEVQTIIYKHMKEALNQ